MSYSFETLDEGHIVIFTMHADFNMANELQPSIQEGHALVEGLDGPIVYITDARGLHFSDLGELIEAANATRSVDQEKRLTKHPKVLKSMAVISSRLIQVAAKGLNSASFGHMEIIMYPTIEEALERARSLLKDAGVHDLGAIA